MGVPIDKIGLPTIPGRLENELIRSPKSVVNVVMLYWKYVLKRSSANNQHDTHYITQAPVAHLKSYFNSPNFMSLSMWLRLRHQLLIAMANSHVSLDQRWQI